MDFNGEGKPSSLIWFEIPHDNDSLRKYHLLSLGITLNKINKLSTFAFEIVFCFPTTYLQVVEFS